MKGGHPRFPGNSLREKSYRIKKTLQREIPENQKNSPPF